MRVPDEVSNTESLTWQLSAFFRSFVRGDIPPEVAEKAKTLIMDTIGVGIAGSKSSEARPVLDVILEAGGRKEALVWGNAVRVPATSAAFINGIFAHVLEMDDTHRATYLHAGAFVIPAAMAIGEKRRVSGREFLGAVIAGYETAIRIALSVSPEHRLRGFHTTSTVGVFGAAMTAALLLKLDDLRMVNALGLAGTQAAGLFQFLYDGSGAKRIHPGRSSQSGVLSALLAERGFAGSPAILEGTYGFGKVMSDRFDPAVVADKLGSHWHILEVGIKPYSACRFCHAPIDGALKIRATPGFDSSMVEFVEVIGSQQLYDQTGNQDPQTVAAAQLSTPFSVALALHVGRIMPEDVEKGLQNPSLRSLSRLVKVNVNPALLPTSRAVTVNVRYHSGKQETAHILLPTGEPENPLSRELLEKKFMDLTVPVVGDKAAQRLHFKVGRIDQLKDISSLSAARIKIRD
jgi:2-methylcitrate dehydratase PrpD